jgi:hypothetical protein
MRTDLLGAVAARALKDGKEIYGTAFGCATKMIAIPI